MQRGKKGNDFSEQEIQTVYRLALELEVHHIHVFERDSMKPGERGFEPGPSSLTNDIAEKIRSQVSRDENEKTCDELVSDAHKPEVNQMARLGDRVLDVILVEPDYWWVGYHVVEAASQRWSGGVPSLASPADVISRAYYKVAEALAWSMLPIKSGHVCVEIGSAPGGSCQYLLEQGFQLIAIDPANLVPRIAHHPALQHIRRRAHEVRRSWLKPAQWLFCDANVSPREVLTAIEGWHKDGLMFQGMLITLKIADAEWFEQLTEHRERVIGWGYSNVKIRQLAYNRHEVCLLATP